MLYISKNTRAPEAPGNEPQVRRRQRDAALVAWDKQIHSMTDVTQSGRNS